MPFALAFIGIILLVSALRGTSGALFGALKADFTGTGNYFYWVIAILVIGSIGYVKKLEPISNAFLALLAVVFFISNKGFFAQFSSALSAGPGTGCTTPSSSNGPLSFVFSLPSTITQSGTILGNQAATSGASSVMNTPANPNGVSNFWTNLNSALGSGFTGMQ